MKTIITIQHAAELLADNNVVFMDTQFIFGKSSEGRSYYEAQHIPGAVYFHLDEDLSGPIEEHGGRHPIPPKDLFVEKLRVAGISNDTTVIVYDNTGGATAARGWWLMKYFGHENTYMLEQPIQKWIEAGYPVTEQLPSPQRGSFTADVQRHLQVTKDYVLQHIGDEQRLLIDARVEDVYTGERATKYKKNGHIPSAKNLFWERLLDEQGRLQNEAYIHETLNASNKEQEIIVYCGAGVTACANIIAFEQAGYSNVKLYVGSWGDWVSYHDTPTEMSEKV